MFPMLTSSLYSIDIEAATIKCEEAPKEYATANGTIVITDKMTMVRLKDYYFLEVQTNKLCYMPGLSLK